MMMMMMIIKIIIIIIIRKKKEWRKYKIEKRQSRDMFNFEMKSVRVYLTFYISRHFKQLSK